MNIVSFTGKSGTGKSFQATALAQKRNIDAIIDDGLLIYKGQIVAGSSAKKCATKAGAIKTALFYYAEQRDEVIEALDKHKPDTLMIIGTSDRMVDWIVSALNLHIPDERVYIEDITTKKERDMASNRRMKQGEHVIPAPVAQLRRDFAGYFMNPLKHIRDFAMGTAVGGTTNIDEGPDDRTVVRPRFSYFGTFRISEQVLRDIIAICAEKYSDYLIIVDRLGSGNTTNLSMTIDVRAIKGSDTIEKCLELQQDVYNAIVKMTSFKLDSVNVRIKDFAEDEEELHKRMLH
ncbi:MAG: hypothetical protein GX083_01025 [Clostridiales bacterium]|nr:hypothetical protein [Clostridiales bacterium]